MTGLPVTGNALNPHPMDTYRFKKAERLCSKILINNLFSKGNRVLSQFPFRVLWQFVSPNDIQGPAQMMVSVSKKHFAKAVHRNKIKRQVRELYRLHKHILYQALEQKEKSVTIAIIFQDKQMTPHAEMKMAFEQILKKLIQQIEKAT